MTLFLAGHETTAQLMTWTWYLLSRTPRRRGAPPRRAGRASWVSGSRPSRTSRTCRTPRRSSREVDADVPARLRAGAARARGGLDPRATRSRGLDGPHEPVRRAPRPALVSGSVPVRSLDAGSGDAGGPRPRHAFFPFGGGPARLHRRGVRLDGGEAPARDHRAALGVRIDPARPVALQPMVTLRPRGTACPRWSGAGRGLRRGERHGERTVERHVVPSGTPAPKPSNAMSMSNFARLEDFRSSLVAVSTHEYGLDVHRARVRDLRARGTLRRSRWSCFASFATSIVRWSGTVSVVCTTATWWPPSDLELHERPGRGDARPCRSQGRSPARTPATTSRRA